jgi:hypothetical protein
MGAPSDIDAFLVENRPFDAAGLGGFPEIVRPGGKSDGFGGGVAVPLSTGVTLGSPTRTFADRKRDEVFLIWIPYRADPRAFGRRPFASRPHELMTVADSDPALRTPSIEDRLPGEGGMARG